MSAQSARQNATNSELDAKKIVTNSGLTTAQKDKLIEQYVEIKVDRMDTQELVDHVTENLKDWYSDFSLEELKDTIDVNDDGLFDELVDNVTQQYAKLPNTFGGQS